MPKVQIPVSLESETVERLDNLEMSRAEAIRRALAAWSWGDGDA